MYNGVLRMNSRLGLPVQIYYESMESDGYMGKKVWTTSGGTIRGIPIYIYGVQLPEAAWIDTSRITLVVDPSYLSKLKNGMMCILDGNKYIADGEEHGWRIYDLHGNLHHCEIPLKALPGV